MSKSFLRGLVATIVTVVAGAAIAQNARAITVTEVVIARSIEDHEPVEPGTSFSRTGGPLVCFIRIANTTRAEGAVLVSWEGADAPAASARGGTRLTVAASSRYRTYARSAVTRAAGNYRCVVRSEDGDVLGSADFSITE